MGDLTEERIATVRKLLDQAPDTAVQSLRGLLVDDLSSGDAVGAIRELIYTESLDRRLRRTVFSPLAPLFGPAPSLRRMSFPAKTWPDLWRAITCAAPELIDQAKETLGLYYCGLNSDALYDELCRHAAQGLRDRDQPEFRSLAAALDAEPGRSGRLVKVLELTPLLRQSLPKLPAWLINTHGEHDAAMRLAFKEAADIAEDAGFLFLEVLFAHLDEPSEILRLISVLTNQPTDRYLAASELASFGERLLESIDKSIETVRSFDARRGLEGGVAAASAASNASLTLTEFEQRITLAKAGIWGARVFAQRHALAQAMEMRLRETEPAVFVALPAQMVRSGVKRLRGAAIVSSPPDRVAVDRAMGLLALLDGCRLSAAAGGFGALRTRVAEALDVLLDAYCQELLDLLRRVRGDNVHAGALLAYLDVAAEMVGLLRDPKAAEIVRRRAAAA